MATPTVRHKQNPNRYFSATDSVEQQLTDYIMSSIDDVGVGKDHSLTCSHPEELVNRVIDALNASELFNATYTASLETIEDGDETYRKIKVTPNA